MYKKIQELEKKINEIIENKEIKINILIEKVEKIKSRVNCIEKDILQCEGLNELEKYKTLVKEKRDLEITIQLYEKEINKLKFSSSLSDEEYSEIRTDLFSELEEIDSKIQDIYTQKVNEIIELSNDFWFNMNLGNEILFKLQRKIMNIPKKGKNFPDDVYKVKSSIGRIGIIKDTINK
ncbi:hypothetical protein [Helcococcus kunzii]|uniref:hypothetical protein n=1 Tax=Helcococcus kunzii TaxID=40091 RepID=UPI0024AE4FEC|nr:hypothetical protein [Helcococcus kunzii]